jgi:hypothetical protein
MLSRLSVRHSGFGSSSVTAWGDILDDNYGDSVFNLLEGVKRNIHENNRTSKEPGYTLEAEKFIDISR